MTTDAPAWKPCLTDEETCRWLIGAFLRNVQSMRSSAEDIERSHPTRPDFPKLVAQFKYRLDTVNHDFDRYMAAINTLYPNDPKE